MLMKLPESFTGSFSYVDCGAAGDLSNSLLSIFSTSQYIGFDPELTQPAKRDSSSILFPVAVSKQSEEIQFYRTKNPNCSSFFVPNQGFLDRFMQVSEFFEIVETATIRTVSLDEYLYQQGIRDVDFIELDTQGSELGILQGANELLSSSVLGIRVEVEFSPMYHDQPLFGDVDSYLREFGFMLFDLDRYHLRRRTASTKKTASREQVIWGQALYFKDWSIAIETFTKQKLSKLAMIASYYGFHSYSWEIFDHLLRDDIQILTLQEKAELKAIYFSQNSELQSPFVRFLKNSRSTVWRSLNWLKKDKTTPGNSYFWKD